MPRIEDAEFSRLYLNLVLADVRKAEPGIKTSKAKFNVWSSTDGHGYRWMVFEYEGVKYEGYFANAYEGRAKGWEAWLKDKKYD